MAAQHDFPLPSTAGPAGPANEAGQWDLPPERTLAQAVASWLHNDCPLM